MQLGYEKLMDEYDLTAEDFDKETQAGIRSITHLKNLIESKRRVGSKITPEAIDKIKFADKSLINEILDYIEDNDLDETDDEKNEDDLEADTKGGNADNGDGSNDDADNEENDDREDEEGEDDMGDEGSADIGDILDNEFRNLLSQGMTNVRLDQLRGSAPKTYEIIWDEYENGEINGIETSFFRLVETAPDSLQFTLSKI